jgi:hypothetical protein
VGVHPDAKLDKMIEEAIVDAYDESEQTVGFYTLLEEHLATPFKTEMLGVEVTVERLDMTDDEQIVAVCARGKSRQCVPILDLPLPTPPPIGADWIMLDDAIDVIFFADEGGSWQVGVDWERVLPPWFGAERAARRGGARAARRG